jgi:hypothetical protein
MKQVLLIIFIFIFTSCSNTYDNYSKKVSSYFKTNASIDFLDITYELTTPLCEKINEDTVLYISDYVNEKHLKNKSQFGFLLANQTKVNILNPSCTQTIKIQDLQLSKSLKIGKNGSRILTRDINDIKNTQLNDDKQILIGSYLFTNSQVIFFLKLVDLSDGNIIATTSTTRILNDEFKALEGIQTSYELKKLQEEDIYTPMHL